MSVSNILTAHGVTMDQAREFLIANAATPQVIYDVANQFGISFSGLGEIVDFAPAQVQAFFIQANLGPTITALARIGLTMSEAQSIVNTSLQAGALGDVFAAVKALGLDIQALANVSGHWTVAALESQFAAAGLNPADIGGTAAPGNNTGGGPSIVADDFLALAPLLVTFNTHTGDLSSAALRAAVLAKGVSADAYNAFFSPSHYADTADGLLGPADLGFSHLGNIAATTENMESLYYGTTINTFTSIDQAEANQIANFVNSHQAQLEAADAATMQAYVNLLITVFEDQASPSMIPEGYLSTVIVESTASVINMAGDSGAVLFGDPASFLGMF